MSRIIKYRRNSRGNKDDLARRIGGKLKELRKSIGLSMKQLAGETKLSTALFSRIENGLVMPSIPTLQEIANALKVDIGYFLTKEEERGYVISLPENRRIRLSERSKVGKASYELELLADAMENPFMEPAIVTLIGKDEEVEFAKHEGQEFMYVLEGRLELTLGTKKYILKKGDSAYWNGSVPHKGISLSKKPAKTLNVHLVPGKRTGTFQIKS